LIGLVLGEEERNGREHEPPTAEVPNGAAAHRASGASRRAGDPGSDRSRAGSGCPATDGSQPAANQAKAGGNKRRCEQEPPAGSATSLVRRSRWPASHG
jgi:hypothetical protein